MPTDFETALAQLSLLYEHLNPEQRRLLLQNLAIARAATEQGQVIAADPKDLVRVAQAEITQPPPRKLSDADLQTFKAFLKAKPWMKGNGKSPSEFIRTDCAYWLERNLSLADIRKVQPSLASAYSVELSRNPSKRIESLYVKPQTAPIGTPIAKSKLRVSELTEDELIERRAKAASQKAAWRKSKRADKAMP